DAPLSRTGLETLARAAATGMARRIVPVHTPFDGDVTFAVSTAPEAVDLPSSVLLVLGILGAEALARAIERAVTVGRGSRPGAPGGSGPAAAAPSRPARPEGWRPAGGGRPAPARARGSPARARRPAARAGPGVTPARG